jgi:O-antigen/teichoic acid export membrane protein
MVRERRRRLRWLAPAVGIFLVLVFAFTRELLGVFRPEFVDEGVAAVRLLAVASAFTMLFALAPTYLKYQRHNHATFATMACAAAVQMLLLLLLVPRLKATGAAAAFAASACGMYGVFALMAHRELVRLRVAGGGEVRPGWRGPPGSGQRVRSSDAPGTRRPTGRPSSG